jgi:pimeloyl-ACP methyl ester carboxylesterase
MGIRGAILLAAVLCIGQSCAGQSAGRDPSPHDTSPHTTQFITVDEKVKLEVLDWGGGGQSVVLLAGLGNTAHVFDDFAPKLTADGYHVYGITRRGYGASNGYGASGGDGASGAPEFGYSADRLGDDVLAVIGALKLDRPVLAGNGLAGEELSSVGSRHPEKVAGLIYLDAAYSYAYYDRTRGDLFFDLLDVERKLAQMYVLLPAGSSGLKKDLTELRKELTQLQASNGLPEDPRFAPPARRLLESKIISTFEKDLQEEQQRKPEHAAPARPEPAKTVQERKRLFDELLQTSLPGFERDLREAEKGLQSAFKKPAPAKAQGWSVPEAELRVQGEATPRAHAAADRATQAILQGRQKYTYLKVPILAIYCLPHPDDDPTEASDEAQAKAFESGVRSARVVRLPHANSMVFLSNEADVLREMNAFLGGLK